MQAERPNSKINLCDNCTRYPDYPYCTDSNRSDIFKFGDGVGHDNVIQCLQYDAKGKGACVDTVLFSELLLTKRIYKSTADRLFSSLEIYGTPYLQISGACDIWVRDFMPVKTQSGNYVSFRYEPSYHKTAKQKAQRTVYRRDLHDQLLLPEVTYSDTNLDGGNVVFSPSKSRVIISDRVFSENPERICTKLVSELNQLLEAQVIIIPSYKDDFTGHADGMVRFVNEDAVMINEVDAGTELEQVLKNHGFDVVYFPYFAPNDPYGISAVGCYINFLEMEERIFLPIFEVDTDNKAIVSARRLFDKVIIPIDIREIAKEGGGLNCISWEI